MFVHECKGSLRSGEQIPGIQIEFKVSCSKDMFQRVTCVCRSYDLCVSINFCVKCSTEENLKNWFVVCGEEIKGNVADTGNGPIKISTFIGCLWVDGAMKLLPWMNVNGDVANLFKSKAVKK